MKGHRPPPAPKAADGPILRFGATRTAPFPDRVRANPPSGRRVNVRSRPDRLSKGDIVDLLQAGAPFVAFQRTTTGEKPAGSGLPRDSGIATATGRSRSTGLARVPAAAPKGPRSFPSPPPSRPPPVRAPTPTPPTAPPAPRTPRTTPRNRPPPPPRAHPPRPPPPDPDGPVVGAVTRDRPKQRGGGVPGAARGMSGGGANVEEISIRRPPSAIDAAAASRISTTWAACSALARCGRPSAIAPAISATPRAHAVPRNAGRTCATGS